MRCRSLRVAALDAAQPFDFEAKARAALAHEQRLTIGIVGFGTFGQFLARRMAAAGHRVLATSRQPYHDAAAAAGAEFFQDADDFCEEHPDVVILATSILSTAAVLRALPVQRLKRNTLFVDVLSVKAFPKQLLLRELPPEMDILCTHPMFGPDSGKGSWRGLNFMYEAVRVGAEPARAARVDNFLRFFRNEGCRMVEMSCEEHDRQAASTQFITHTVGRVLGAMRVAPTDINTKGFEALLNLVDNTSHDSFDLYYGLFLYNANATEELQRLEQAFDTVKKQLLGRMHDIVRKELQLPGTEPPATAAGSGGSRASSPQQQQQEQPPRLLGAAPVARQLGGGGEAVTVEVLAPEPPRGGQQ
jgi:arogenate dehydrogenase (NADP+)